MNIVFIILSVLIIGFVMLVGLRFANRKVIQAEQILYEQYPTWQNFNKNLDRNLSKVIIGSSYAFRHRKIFEADRYWCLPQDNIYVQFEILKHFYSIIKTGGNVTLILSSSEIQEYPKRIYRTFHYRILQAALLPPKRVYKKYLNYPILNIEWAVKILNLWCFNGGKLKVINKEIVIPSETKNTIKEISKFCNDRDLTFNLIIPDIDYKIEF